MSTIQICNYDDEELHINDRNLVRDSNGYLYAVTTDLDRLMVWKSIDDGATWTLKDNAHTDTNANAGMEYPCSCAIDSNDVIHIIYGEWVSGGSPVNGYVRYSAFNAVTDLYTVVGEQINNSNGNYPTNFNSIVVDSNDIPHVIYDVFTLTSTNRTYYNNRVGGSWSNELQVYTTRTYPHTILIDKDNLPVVVYTIYTGAPNYYYHTYACIGDANDPTGFTSQLVTTTHRDYWHSVAMNIDGNIYIGYAYRSAINIYPSPAFAIHEYGDAWATWTLETTCDAIPDFHIEGLSIMVDSGDFTMLYIDGDFDTVFKVSYSGAAWSGVSEFITSLPYIILPPVAKWAYWVDNDKDGDNVGQIDGRPPMECVVSAWDDDASTYKLYYSNGDTLMQVIMIIEQ